VVPVALIRTTFTVRARFVAAVFQITRQIDSIARASWTTL
jgi:hypothetical protein